MIHNESSIYFFLMLAICKQMATETFYKQKENDIPIWVKHRRKVLWCTRARNLNHADNVPTQKHRMSTNTKIMSLFVKCTHMHAPLLCMLAPVGNQKFWRTYQKNSWKRLNSVSYTQQWATIFEADPVPTSAGPAQILLRELGKFST